MVSTGGGVQAQIESQSVRILLDDILNHDSVGCLSNLYNNKKNEELVLIGGHDGCNLSVTDSGTRQNSLIINEETQLTIWYTNATSLNNKIDELRLLLTIHKPDVVCITETWFKAESDVNINDYNIFRLDRATHGGGVCIYVKNTIMSNESNVARLNETDIEQIWACLCFDKQKLLIGCIYRPPNSTPSVNSLIVESIVSARKSCYQKLYSDVVITGDFNFNSIDWSDSACPYVTGDPQAQSFIDCLNECFLTQCVSKPTFQKANYDSNNILDFIITNYDEKLSSIEHSPALGTTKQGHHLLKCKYIVNESRPVNDKRKTVKLYQNGNYKLFSD
jgi:hypothetical protein